MDNNKRDEMQPIDLTYKVVHKNEAIDKVNVVSDEIAEKHMQKSVVSKPRRSLGKQSSIFGIELEDAQKDTEFQLEYIAKLAKEEEEWADILNEIENDLQSFKNTELCIDENILTEDQKTYFRYSFNFDGFISKSKEFCEKANKYLANHSEFMELYNELNLESRDLIQNISYDIMRENGSI